MLVKRPYWFNSNFWGMGIKIYRNGGHTIDQLASYKKALC
jgi:hypothetical protein